MDISNKLKEIRNNYIGLSLGKDILDSAQASQIFIWNPSKELLVYLKDEEEIRQKLGYYIDERIYNKCFGKALDIIEELERICVKNNILVFNANSIIAVALHLAFENLFPFNICEFCKLINTHYTTMKKMERKLLPFLSIKFTYELWESKNI